MIGPVAQAVADHAQRNWGDYALATMAGSGLAGMTIGQINEYLQAGAFIVAMLAGLSAAVYHITATIRGRKK